MRRATLLAAILTCSPFTLVAQQPIFPGERVRFTAPLPCGANRSCVEPRSGVVVALELDTVTVDLFERTDGITLDLSEHSTGRVGVPIASIRSIEVVRGRKPRTLGGAIVGVLAGGVSGLVVGMSSDTTFRIVEVCGQLPDFVFGGTDFGCFNTTKADITHSPSWVGAAAGAAIGAAIGAVVGSLLTTDRWEEVPLDRLRLSFVPQRGGRFALGVSVTF